MRKTLVSAVVLCLVTSSCSYAGNWSWSFHAKPDPNRAEFYSGAAGFGVNRLSSDGYDSTDQPMFTGVHAHIGVYHQNGVDGWTEPTGFWQGDARSEILSPQQLPQVWDFYVWMDVGVPQDVPSTYFFSWGVFPPHSAVLPPYVKVTLEFVRNAIGLPPNSDVGEVWNLTTNRSGNIFLPINRADNGLDGYHFRMTADVVPEPSSLAGLALGLTGAFGIMKRRWMTWRAAPTASFYS